MEGGNRRGDRLGPAGCRSGRRKYGPGRRWGRPACRRVTRPKAKTPRGKAAKAGEAGGRSRSRGKGPGERNRAGPGLRPGPRHHRRRRGRPEFSRDGPPRPNRGDGRGSPGDPSPPPLDARPLPRKNRPLPSRPHRPDAPGRRPPDESFGPRSEIRPEPGKISFGGPFRPEIKEFFNMISTTSIMIKIYLKYIKISLCNICRLMKSYRFMGILTVENSGLPAQSFMGMRT